jgi:outer membrane immunogenic protein
LRHRLHSWTGFYVGGNVGYGWGDAHTDIAGNATTVALPFFFVTFPTNVAFADSNTTRLSGVIGGGQIGYNYQFNPRWVLGFEADIQGPGKRGSNAFAAPFSTPICSVAAVTGCLGYGTLNGVAATTYNVEIDWFGTVRGRVGFLIGDQVLLYGTGGLAYGRVGLSGITNVNGAENTSGNSGLPPVAPLTPGAAAFNESKTNIGWTAGAGIEGRFASWLPAGWSWKLEYLYVDLGFDTVVSPFPGGSSAFALGPPGRLLTSPFTGAITMHTHFTDNIVRIGVNYQFQ